ncbi:MAG: ferritin-like domain-containing protein [Thermoanaerobacteraceae bacterium]|nr:ferritin-like domain-containing protein [Thermoanaerobacteraceae bacterium]
MPYKPGTPPAYGPLKLQIPNLPILGPHDWGKLLKNIYDSIVAEATAADLYYRLLRETPNQLHREFVHHAYQDELKHLEAFSRLYSFFTGQKPHYTIDPVQYRSYEEGLLISLQSELEAAEFYHEVILSSTDGLVRDTFFLAMGDELEHATRFGVLYAMTKGSPLFYNVADPQSQGEIK